MSGTKSKNGFLSFFTKRSQEKKSFSQIVFDSLSGYDGLTDDGKKERQAAIQERMKDFPESPEKSLLIGAVEDCFSSPKEALENSDLSAISLDGLSAICVAQAAVISGTTDSKKEDEEKAAEEKAAEDAKKKEEEEKASEDAKAKEEADKKAAEDAKKKEEGKEKGKDTEDSAAAIVAAMDEVKQALAGIPDLVNNTVKQALGLEKKETIDSVSVDPLLNGAKDNSYLLKNMF